MKVIDFRVTLIDDSPESMVEFLSVEEPYQHVDGFEVTFTMVVEVENKVFKGYSVYLFIEDYDEDEIEDYGNVTRRKVRNFINIKNKYISKIKAVCGMLHNNQF